MIFLPSIRIGAELTYITNDTNLWCTKKTSRKHNK